MFRIGENNFCNFLGIDSRHVEPFVVVEIFIFSLATDLHSPTAFCQTVSVELKIVCISGQ